MTTAGESKRWVRFEWDDVIAAVPLPATTKVVAWRMASYCDGETGENVHPGEERLARDCNLSTRCVDDHLEVLRHLGLLVMTRKGYANQHGARADDYALAFPADVEEHVGRYLNAQAKKRQGEPKKPWVRPECCTRVRASSKPSATRADARSADASLTRVRSELNARPLLLSMKIIL